MRAHAGEPDRAVEMNSTLDIRIRVRERLSPRLAGAFDGMTLVRCGGATDLVGEVADQTQLHGLLARIRDLGLELESVNVFAANPAAPAADGSSTCTASPTPTSTPKQRQGAHP
jgi:hypothetical protein